MGLFGLSLPKRREITNLASRVYDQANIFDNNRTFKQRTPTNTKSAFQQGGQFTGQLARGTAGGLAKMANTAAAQQSQIYATQRMVAANLTNNPTAFRNASRFADAANQNFTENKGGLLNTGTFYSAEDAKKGELGTGVKKIGGGTAQAMLEAYSLGTAAPVGASVKQFGIREGLKQTAPALGKTFLANTAQGGVTTANQGGTRNDILKSAALSGVLGTAGDVGLGIGGAYASKAAKNALPAVSAKAKAIAKNQRGTISGSEPDMDVEQRLMLDYMKNPAAKPSSNSLTGEGAQAPLQMSAAKRQSIIDNMRRSSADTTPPAKQPVSLLNNESGGIPLEMDAPTPKPAVTAKQPTRTSGYRPRTADEAIREISSIGGEEIGQSTTNLGLPGKAISGITGGKYTTTRGLNPFRAASDAAGKAFNESSEASMTSAGGAPVVNKARAVFAGTGLTDETKQIVRIRTGQNANINDLMTRVHKKADDIQAAYGDDARELIDRTIRDEKYTRRVYGEAPKRLEDLPPELKTLVKEKMDQNRVVNDLNRQTGIIDEKTWKAGTEGQHIGRIFNIPKSEKQMIRDGVGAMLETNAGIKRKDISKMADEVIDLLERDPLRAIDIRMEMALRNKAFSETMDAYAGRGFIKKRAPNDSYIQVNGKKWGKYDGQFVERGILEDLTDNRVFNNDMMQSYDKLIAGYKSSVIGTSDRLQKAFKTTMAPGTVVGNFFSNPMIFNVGAGTNPLTQIYDMAGAYRKMAKGLSDADVYEARRLGVIGGDSGRILTGSSSEKLAIGGAKQNIAKRALDKFGRVYSAIDDGAKLGLWKRLQKKGMNPQDAALEVAKFTQDYNNVGRTITLIADTPVLGKPFARFSPELVRLIKNNATRAPHRLLAGIAAVAYIGNKMSEGSGESAEERAAREGAVGQTKIPGTAWINKMMGGPEQDISMNLAINDKTVEQALEKVGVKRDLPDTNSAVNIARSMGLNFPIEPGTDPNQALIEQLLPFEIPITKDALGNNKFDPTKVVTSMTARPVIEQLFDRNFMGRKVSDPTNQAYDSQGNVMKYNDLPEGDQTKNRLRALATSVMPLGNEIDSLQAAFRGKETSLGKERTVPQALLRAVGIKAEDNSPAVRAKRADTAEYFEVTKQAESDFLNNNKDLEELYFKVFPKTKDRATGLKLSDQITPEKWTRVQSDTSGRLYNFMKQQAESANKMDGAPIDPVFKIPTTEQQKQVLELRSKPSGEDIEMDNILEATQGWYREFKKAEQKYYDESTAYYKSKNLPETRNQRAVDYGNVKWPEQDKLISQYYSTKESNPDAAKAMFETTNLSQAFDKYKQDKLKYYNAKRKIEGHPPLDEGAFNNVTFGYEDDERKVYNQLKYGKGYGSYSKYGKGGGSGGGGGGSSDGFNVSKYLSSISGSSSGSKPKVSVSVKAKKIAARSTSAGQKPKVSLKKSRV